MNIPKVSVIMPVYNTDLYVKDAILSISNQTLKEIEIIIINDGSTDNSIQIIQELANNDKRIQFYSQINQGQSVARNLGLNKAVGEYIYFMDSDDLLDLETLECCYKRCEQDELDFVFFDADIFSESNDLTLSYNYHRPEIKEKTYNGVDLIESMINNQTYRSALCLSFIRKKYLDTIGLSFYPNIIHEDELFSMILYINASKVGRINKQYFKRRLRHNSTITNKFSWRNIIGYYICTEELKKISLEKPKREKKIISKYIKIVINVVIKNCHNLSISDKLTILSHPIFINNIRIIKIKTIAVFLLKSIIRRK